MIPGIPDLVDVLIKDFYRSFHECCLWDTLSSKRHHIPDIASSATDWRKDRIRGTSSVVAPTDGQLTVLTFTVSDLLVILDSLLQAHLITTTCELPIGPRRKAPSLMMNGMVSEYSLPQLASDPRSSVSIPVAWKWWLSLLCSALHDVFRFHQVQSIFCAMKVKKKTFDAFSVVHSRAKLVAGMRCGACRSGGDPVCLVCHLFILGSSECHPTRPSHGVWSGASTSSSNPWTGKVMLCRTTLVMSWFNAFLNSSPLSSTVREHVKSIPGLNLPGLLLAIPPVWSDNLTNIFPSACFEFYESSVF